MNFVKFKKILSRTVYYLNLFCPQLNTHTYKLSRLLDAKYALKDLFAFAEEIVEQDSEFFMGSLDIDSLFNNIPLEETVDICTNTLFENTERVDGLSKIEFRKLLSVAIKESNFIFIGKLYKQVE